MHVKYFVYVNSFAAIYVSDRYMLMTYDIVELVMLLYMCTSVESMCQYTMRTM